MRKNLTSKTILIVAVLLVFIFGIFGIPQGISGQAWRDALAKRISLGLDLKGGTHLVLEVAENNENALGWYRKRGFRKLDAAIFLAQSVDTEPELLPPRQLSPQRREEPAS